MAYIIQINDEVREATAEETAVIDAQRDYAKAQAKIKADAAIARQAVLDRLGITADEAALLLG
jgi:hypothetical protein